jgi:hypothetical protein
MVDKMLDIALPHAAGLVTGQFVRCSILLWQLLLFIYKFPTVFQQLFAFSLSTLYDSSDFASLLTCTTKSTTGFSFGLDGPLDFRLFIRFVPVYVCFGDSANRRVRGYAWEQRTISLPGVLFMSWTARFLFFLLCAVCLLSSTLSPYRWTFCAKKTLCSSWFGFTMATRARTGQNILSDSLYTKHVSYNLPIDSL